MNADGHLVGLQRGGEGKVAIGGDGQRRAIGADDGPGLGAIDLNFTDIGHVLDAQHGEGMFAHGRGVRAGGFVLHDYFPFETPRALPSMVFDPACSILTVRTRVSGRGRCRSICSKPLSIVAFLTSIPSASTKARWNCRAAMPRCRKIRFGSSSAWRPRMTS